MTHPFGDDSEIRRHLVDHLSAQTLPRIVQLTLPLFAGRRDRAPQLVASGIVLEVGTSRFLITATHVLRDWPGVSISIGDLFFEIRGDRVTIHSEGCEPGSDDDKLDISLLRLEAGLAERIEADQVLMIADLDLSASAVGQDCFLMSGYPERRNRDGLDGESFTVRAYSLLMYDGDEALYQALGLDAQAHLALPFDPNDTWDMERQVAAPNFQGISGGGLWRIQSDDASPLRETRLAAIAVEQHRKGRHRHVLATRVRLILTAVHERYPDLRATLEDALRDAAT
jgi:hypothetical protein